MNQPVTFLSDGGDTPPPSSIAYKSEAFRRFAVLGHTLTHDHLEPSFRSRLLVFCMDITAVDSNDKRCGRIRKLIPVPLAATNEHVLLFS